MKTATLVKPKRLSDCNDTESVFDLFNYSEICEFHTALLNTAKFTSPRLCMARFDNHSYSIKKVTKSKPAIKVKSFKDTNKLALNRRKRLHGF